MVAQFALLQRPKVIGGRAEAKRCGAHEHTGTDRAGHEVHVPHQPAVGVEDRAWLMLLVDVLAAVLASRRSSRCAYTCESRRAARGGGQTRSARRKMAGARRPKATLPHDSRVFAQAGG